MTMIYSVTAIICFAIASITAIEIFAPANSRSDIVTMIAFLMPTISSILNLIKCYENGAQNAVIQHGLETNTQLTQRTADASDTAAKLAAINADKVDRVLKANGIKVNTSDSI